MSVIFDPSHYRNESLRAKIENVLDDKALASAINHPAHYTHGRIETIDVIEDWQLGYHLGNAVKYISRCNHKGQKVQDLRKAIWYIEREILRESNKDDGE
jgi:hypothetical protein